MAGQSNDILWFDRSIHTFRILGDEGDEMGCGEPRPLFWWVVLLGRLIEISPRSVWRHAWGQVSNDQYRGLPPPPLTLKTHVPLYHSPYHSPPKRPTDSHCFHQILPIHYVIQWLHLDIKLTVNASHKCTTIQLETWLEFKLFTYLYVFSHSWCDCCNPGLNELQTIICSMLG